MLVSTADVVGSVFAGVKVGINCSNSDKCIGVNLSMNCSHSDQCVLSASSPSFRHCLAWGSNSTGKYKEQQQLEPEYHIQA